MGQKLRILLLVTGVFLTASLLWTHYLRVDLEVEGKLKNAENERHGYVISSDFGLMKEKLIESHKDHWRAYAKAERMARWELAETVGLAIVFFTLGIDSLRTRRRKLDARK